MVASISLSHCRCVVDQSVGEQTRTAHFKATQVVQAFTEQFFAEELASHKRIRLIYMVIISHACGGKRNGCH